MKHLAFVAAVGLALGAAPLAMAENGIQASHVQTARLDLAKQEDVSTLFARIRLAAVRACEPEAAFRPSAAERRAVRACREQAVARTVAQLNEPALTEMYERERTDVSDQIVSR